MEQSQEATTPFARDSGPIARAAADMVRRKRQCAHTAGAGSDKRPKQAVSSRLRLVKGTAARLGNHALVARAVQGVPWLTACIYAPVCGRNRWLC